MNDKYRYIFLVRFKNEISFAEIPLFRGAVLNALGGDAPLLFHNHTGGETFRYAYPLIQYKRIKGKAAIFCIGEGVETIGHFLSEGQFHMKLGTREVEFEINEVSPKRNIIQTWDSEFNYRVRHWLPLNSENYVEYKKIDSCTDQIAFLENIMVANLISLAKGLRIDVADHLYCRFTSFNEPHLFRVKGVKMMAFDVEFKTNMSLPDYIGIGKHVSIGYGTVTRKIKNENK